MGALGCVAVRAESNPQRAGFCASWPASYSDWQDAFLSGNGKMGIMVFGNPLDETVVYDDRGFNLANGDAPERSFDQVSAADLQTIRDDCVAGKFAEADNLAAAATHYKGGGDGARHPGYGMYITIPGAGDVRGYSRTCDFRTGEILVRWTDDRGDWVRKAFVSRKDNVAVQYVTAPTKGTLSCTIRLGTEPGMGLPRAMTFVTAAKADLLTIRARYMAKIDAGYEGVTRVAVTGGTAKVDGDVLRVEGARSVLLLTRTAKYRDHCEDQWNKGDIQRDLAALPASYDALLAAHVALHQAIYDRVKIDLGASPAERAKTNEELLAEQKNSAKPVPALWERIFDAGRYYFLSSSSDKTPPDLLGIWTGDCRAGWGGYYHTDANLNLQIGAGNIGDMPEAMEGYFALNEAWRGDLETNARKLLGCRGILAPGNSPGPQSGLMASLNVSYPYQYATGEEAWLLYPFWEHYLITGDVGFLKNRLYPLLKELGEFYEDFLVSQDGQGHYIFAGSVSPENQPSKLGVSLVNNSVFDISGAKFALTALVRACGILGVEQGPGQGIERWSAILKKLPPYLVNTDGALQEWAWPGLLDNYGHRHSSHLLVAWPYREITPESDATLYKAACAALAKKDENRIMTGHGILHDAFIAAVLKNDESLGGKLLRLTKEDFYYSSLFSSHNGDHKIFCSDTCNAVPGIMMEMLVSSEPGRLEFLPALPEDLEKGSVSGVKARCRVTVRDLTWDRRAHTVTAVVRSDIDQSVTLIERDGIERMRTDAAVSDSPIGEIARVVQLKAGVDTSITLSIGQLRYRPPNLALNRPVTVSSDDGVHPAAAAVDGDAGTRWSSRNSDDQWISIDLGDSQPINKVRIDWEKSAAKDFDIEVSDDAQAWTIAKSVTGNGETGWLEYGGLKARGRYVRVHGKTRITHYGFSLWEIQVFGT